jgi:hypothetical protein
MSLVAKLMETAAADTDVLRSLDEAGDQFARFRNVDFLLIAPSREKADIIASFINDHAYGAALSKEIEGKFRVQVLVQMPVTQEVILSVSGFMACIAHVFGASYDGWGCPPQRRA